VAENPTLRTRNITTHYDGGPLNDKITVEAMGDPGPGGANLSYRITLPINLNDGDCETCCYVQVLDFQSGNPVDEINGLSNEVLLAIVQDRLRGFVDGPFSTADNEIALRYVGTALEMLQRRTAARVARGVAGKLEP
jgi:hypothetical protein